MIPPLRIRVSSLEFISVVLAKDEKDMKRPRSNFLCRRMRPFPSKKMALQALRFLATKRKSAPERRSKFIFWMTI